MKNYTCKYDSYFITLGICRNKGKYLLLKIAPTYKFCPGCWDFVFSKPKKPAKSIEENVLLSISIHTGLKGKIVGKCHTFEWIDRQSKIRWIIKPFIVEVENKRVELSEKYTEFKWVRLNSIPKFDIENIAYLKYVLKKTSLTEDKYDSIGKERE